MPGVERQQLVGLQRQGREVVWCLVAEEPGMLSARASRQWASCCNRSWRQCRVAVAPGSTSHRAAGNTRNTAPPRLLQMYTNKGLHYTQNITRNIRRTITKGRSCWKCASGQSCWVSECVSKLHYTATVLNLIGQHVLDNFLNSTCY